MLTTGRPALKYSSVFIGNDARLNALPEYGMSPTSMEER